MAKQLKVNTTVMSGTAISTDSLNSSLTATITVDNPIVQAAEITLNHSTPTAQQIVPTGKTMSTYCYVKNMDTGNYISVRTKSTNVEFLRLKAGEHAFFPVAPSIGCELINSATATSNTMVIYGTFDAKE